MARKPNYRFDRQERDRAKAAKRAEREKERANRSTDDRKTAVASAGETEPDRSEEA